MKILYALSEKIVSISDILYRYFYTFYWKR